MGEGNILIEFCKGDIENLPFKSETFDIVNCMETLMHLPNPQEGMNELARVKKSGGSVIVGINNKLSIENVTGSIDLVRLLSWIYRVIMKKSKKPHPHWAYTPKQFKQFFDKADLRLLKTYGIGLFHPEGGIHIAPGVFLHLVPRSFGGWFLRNIEERFNLGDSSLKNFMNALIGIGVKT